MSFSARPFFRAWIVVALGALGFLIWIDGTHIARMEHVSATTGWSVDAPVVDRRSPTGYAGGRRRLIVAEHSNESYQWIAQTQQMFARSEWRVRRIDTENAPQGRVVHTPSPYRWWLGLVAWIDHVRSGEPIGLAVERAALFADPARGHLHVVRGRQSACVFAPDRNRAA